MGKFGGNRRPHCQWVGWACCVLEMGGPGLNTTDPDAVSVHGTNPQNLVEKILRMRIYDHRYWKEHCFALSAETLVDKAIELQ